MSQASVKNKPVVLTIAGFDPSCGAGIGADLKTMAACGAYGIAAITALTIQNTLAVKQCVAVEPHVLRQQIEFITEDIFPSAVKIGMLACRENVEVVAQILVEHPFRNIVLDPVLRSSSGDWLLEPEGVAIMAQRLLPLAECVTPNLDEAARLTGLPVNDVEDMKKAARRIVASGAKSAVVTGGHLSEAVDVLWDGNSFEVFRERKIESRSTHGTGCTFSSALASHLALGNSLRDSVAAAKRFVTGAILNAAPLGHGLGPLNHFF